MLHNDGPYLTSRKISYFPCAIAAVTSNCTAASRLQTPLGTTVQLI
jgi:hypothetical protein